MKNRIAELLRELWHHRPIIVTFVNFENQQLNGYCDGFMNGLIQGAVDLTITARRTTSNGKKLAGIRGGAA